MRLSASLTLLVLLAGCDPGHGGPDGSVTRDAELADGAPFDAGALTDAGTALRDGSWPWATCPPTVPCDPRSADGCGAESCVLWSASSSCEPTTGALGPGVSCDSVMGCAPGLACFRTREGTGVCGRICCAADEAGCTAGLSCGGSGVLVDGTATEWGRCLPLRSCDVLDPSTSCETREGCYIVDALGNTQCRLAGTGDAGDPCVEQEDCQSGFFCGGVATTRRCVRICRIGAEDCDSGERCVAQAHSPAGTGFCTAEMLLAPR